MTIYVISQCYTSNGWIDEFANPFNTRKEAITYIQDEIKSWEIAGKGLWVGLHNIVYYRDNRLFYKYTIVPKLVKDRINLLPY